MLRQLTRFCRRKLRSRPIGVSLALVSALALAPAGDALAGHEAGGGPVADWMDVTLKEIAGHRVNPPRASRALALVSVALERSSRKGPAQIHGAAAEVLGYLFPDRREVFDASAAELAPSAANRCRNSPCRRYPSTLEAGSNPWRLTPIPPGKADVGPEGGRRIEGDSRLESRAHVVERTQEAVAFRERTPQEM